MDADLRGFRDPLAPVRRYRQSLLDQAAGVHAGVHARVMQAETAHIDAVQRLDAAVEQTSQAWRHRTDPRLHEGLLAHLTQQQARVLAAAQETDRLREELEQARSLMLMRQRQMDALDRHRERALADYRLAWHRQSAAQADTDWIARAGLRKRVGP